MPTASVYRLGMQAVTATDVEFRYGTHIAVTQSSFTIPKASITALIGPNGSGKSTILNAVAGLISPSIGTLDVSVAPSQQRISLVLQSTQVNDALPITVAEVVAMGRYPGLSRFRRLTLHDREVVSKAMRRMAIEDLAQEHLSELSGGQRQRVFVAQGIAQERDLLLLDEPLTGLDLPSAKAVDSVIHEEQERGGTVVMTTHDLSEARVADHVILMAGRVVASGTPTDVLTVANLKEAYGSALLHLEGDEVFFDDPDHPQGQDLHVHQNRSIHVETHHDNG